MTKKNPDKQLSGNHDGRLLNILLDSVILGDVEGLTSKSIEAYEYIQGMLHENETAMKELQERTKRLHTLSAIMMKGMTRHQKLTLGIRRMQREGNNGAGCGFS
jgi:hypothetical protein